MMVTTWYLLVTIAGGVPKTTVYGTEQEACVGFLAGKDASPHVYQIAGKHDSPVISEGDCKPIQQFSPMK